MKSPIMSIEKKYLKKINHVASCVENFSNEIQDAFIRPTRQLH